MSIDFANCGDLIAFAAFIRLMDL